MSIINIARGHKAGVLKGDSGRGRGITERRSPDYLIFAAFLTANQQNYD
jgi:hypothetical protein